jgi:hypothetical protein
VASVPPDEAPLAFDDAPLASNAAEFTRPDAPHSQANVAPPVAREPVKRKKRQGHALDVAVYRVLVDDAGNIRDVVLMRSSGVSSFDAAGEQMIYSGMAALPSWHEASALTVTLHFSRQPH